ncbi:MAG: DUF917 domain-containing protein [Herpetosiphon sp.]
MRLLNGDDIESLAAGAAMLGGGGGGDAYMSKLMARRAIDTYGSVRLVDVAELEDEALVVSLAMIGAPTVGSERPFAEDTFLNAFRMLERYLGQSFDAVMALEIGGYNALAPIPVAAQLGLPLVDADAMGRALPEIQMTSFGVHGITAAPLALSCDNGTRTVIETGDNYWAEHLTRSMTIDMGGAVAGALYAVRGWQVRQFGIANSISRAIKIGRISRKDGGDWQPLPTIQRALNGRLLFEGKVLDVRRQSDTGFARGTAVIDGTGHFQNHKLTIQFQNEYLIAQGNHAVVASVPDLISIFDQRTADPIPVEALRYGFQVAVLGIPAPPVWSTPGGLAIVGPQAFGYAIDYMPCGECGL